MKKIIEQLSAEYFQEVVEIRRHLHQYPELSFSEIETSKYLIDKLNSWGISIDKRWVETGFTAVIDSGVKGPTIAMRADLDALPIHELADVEYASKHKGVMHACGHDVHSACLMGVAKILNSTKGKWKGKAVFIFQPGEEKFPGGASLMIKEGILQHYQPDCMIAQHVYPEMEVGSVGFKEGMYMASADEIYLTVKGKGGHGALPHLNVDPIVISAGIITELQKLTSRFAPPTLPTVLSFGKIIGEGATNVIPNEVKIEGTLRTFDEDWREKYHNYIEKSCKEIANASGGDCEVKIKKGYPFLVNDEDTCRSVRSYAKEYLGNDKVEELSLRMTAEDFSYFSQKCPSVFYRLGVGNKVKGIDKSVHHPEFQIDEEALKIGMGVMSYACVQQLAAINY